MHAKERFDDLMHTSPARVKDTAGAYFAALPHTSALLSVSRHLPRQQVARRLRSKAVISELQSLSSAWDSVIEHTLTFSAERLPGLSDMLDRGEQHALLLSTLAGLSTSIGGAIAIVKKPGNYLLSFLLGVAIGVMATLSILEMWLHNAVEHGPIAITAATAAGVALYYAAQPYFPDFEPHQARIVYGLQTMVIVSLPQSHTLGLTLAEPHKCGQQRTGYQKLTK